MQLLRSQAKTHELYSSYHCHSPPPYRFQRGEGFAVFNLPLQHLHHQAPASEIDGNYHVFFGRISYLSDLITSSVPGCWPMPFAPTATFPPPYSVSSFLFIRRSVLQHFFWLILLESKHSPHLWVLFFNHHSASGRLPSRKGSPLLGLPPNPSAACPSAFHAAHSPVLPTTCHSTPCHSPLNCGNIQHHCQSVPACVSKITLSRTLDDVGSYVHLIWTPQWETGTFRHWSLWWNFCGCLEGAYFYCLDGKAEWWSHARKG